MLTHMILFRAALVRPGSLAPARYIPETPAVPDRPVEVVIEQRKTKNPSTT